jgi:hypothetical protein
MLKAVLPETAFENITQTEETLTDFEQIFVLVSKTADSRAHAMT